MQFRRVECSLHNHMGEPTAYEFYHVTNDIKPIIRCPNDFKNKKLLMASVYAEIVARYIMKDGKVALRKELCAQAYFSYYIELFSNGSQVLIRHPTKHKNRFTETNVYPSPMFKNIVFAAAQNHIFRLAGIKGYRPGTLAHRAYIVFSFYHLVYEKYSPCMNFDGSFFGETFNRVVFSTNNMTMYKKVKLLQEYDTNTCYEGPRLAAVRKWILPSYNRLIDWMDIRKHFGTKRFFYTPKNLMIFNLSAGGGIAPLPSGAVTIDDVKYFIHHSGLKALLFESNLRAFHKFMMYLYREMLAPYYDFEVIRQKREYKKLLGLATLEALAKLPEGMREFFVPSMFHGFLGATLLGQIKKDMCGIIIAIGMNFSFGGAFFTAKRLNYDRDDMIWCQGDIYKLDKNIQKFIIDLFVGTGYLYYDTEHMTKPARRYIRTLFKHFMYHISTKIVLHLGNFVRIENGKVYSGGLETSILDSFAMAFLFSMYIESVIHKYPHLAQYIRQCVHLLLIIILVYGDDHIWCFPKVLRGALSAHGFAIFLADFFEMKLRDYQEFDFFLSVIDRNYQVVKRGPTFLQRLFIECDDPELPPVIAFKETRKILVSMAMKEYDADAGLDIDPIEILLSCIGMAYDCQMNYDAYEVIQDIFDRTLYGLGLVSPEKMLEEFIRDPTNRLKINKLMRRAGETDLTVLSSFPTKRNLRARNIVDLEKCLFGQRKMLEEIDFNDFIVDMDF